jgi:AraC-like DNA-binding protein
MNARIMACGKQLPARQRTSTGQDHTPVVFSTSDVTDGDRLNAWQKAYVDTFVPCRIESNSEEPFWSRFTSMNIGPVMIGSVAGPPKVCVRDKFAAERDKTNYLQVDVLQRGEKISKQCGREIAVCAGEALVFHNREPSFTVSPTTTQVQTIKIPETTIRGRIGDTARYAGVKLSCQVPQLRILAGYLQSLDFAGDLTDASSREMIGGHIVDLVVAALIRVEGRGDPSELYSVKAARLAAIRRLIESAFREPTFDTRHASQRLGISERYIQKLFEETGVTFSDYVAERRLRDAREKLLDRQLDQTKIRDIAWSAGFSDISHFNRLFRRRFGEKPSALRSG